MIKAEFPFGVVSLFVVGSMLLLALAGCSTADSNPRVSNAGAPPGGSVEATPVDPITAETDDSSDDRNEHRDDADARRNERNDLLIGDTP